MRSSFLFIGWVVGALIQAPAQTTWRHSYGAFASEQAARVKVLAGDTLLVGGSSGSFDPGGGDAYVLRIAPDGTRMASFTFGSPLVDRLTGLAILPDGAFVLSGYTNRDPVNGYDGWILKADASGTVLWENTIGGADWDLLESLEPTSDGGFVLAGRTYGGNGSGVDGWLVRVDANGDTLWTRGFGSVGEEALYDARETADGGFILCGQRTDALGVPDAWVVKLADDLSVEWQTIVGGDSVDLARDVVVTSDGGYSIVGSTRSYSIWTEHLHAKLDGSGIQQWLWHWGQINDQEAREHVQLSDGTYLTAGYARTSGAGSSDLFLLRSGYSGDFIFGRTFGGSEEEEAFALDTISSGYVIAGWTNTFGAGNDDVFVVRTDQDGFTASQNVETTFDALSVLEVEEFASLLRIGPVPVSDRLWMHCDVGISGVEVFEPAGRMVLYSSSSGINMDIQLDLPSGWYLASVYLADGNIIRRPIIVQRP